MTTEESKLLNDLVDDGNYMIFWWDPKTRIAEQVVSVYFHEQGNSHVVKFQDGRPLWLDKVKLNDFIMGNRIEPEDFNT